MKPLPTAEAEATFWRNACRKQDHRRAALEALLIDAKALLDHYAHGRPDNWDGSTRRQAFVTLAQIEAALEEQKS